MNSSTFGKGILVGKLTPSEVVKNVYDVTPEWLGARGLLGVAFDLDDTLVPHGMEEPDEKLIALFQNYKLSGIRAAILSNNSEDRVKPFADKLGAMWSANAMKPLKKGFHQMLLELGLPPGKVAFVGDQVFTDILGANRAGLYSVAVEMEPHVRSRSALTRFKRLIEKPFRSRWRRGGS